MNAKNLKHLLKEALTHGQHAHDCVFRRSISSLPARHPKYKAPINIGACNCWKKKAERLIRALGV